MPLKKKLKSKPEEEAHEEEDQEDESESSGSSQGDEFDDQEDDQDEDENESDEQANEAEMLMIDFEAREPQGSDRDTIKMMLKQKFGDAAVNLDELSRIVIEQGETLGNVVFQAIEDEEEEPVAAATGNSSAADEGDIFGVLSGVDLASPRTKTFSAGFVKFLSKNDEFADALKSKRVFYVVNERFINMPVKISIPMFQDLMKSIAKEKLEFDYWLFVAKVIHQPQSRGNSNNSERTFVNAEEEIFEEFSERKFELADSKPSGSSSGFRSSFNVFLVPTAKIGDALNKIISMSE